MNEFTSLFNQFLAIGTIVLQFIIVYIVFNLIFFRKEDNPILSFFKKHTYLLILLIASSGVLLSLFYSEIIGYPACELCILQRFFIYPQVIVVGLLMKFKNKIFTILSILLASIASGISIYHMYVENGGKSGLACVSENISAVTCSARYVYEFGYITIPVMAFTTSFFIIILFINKYSYNKK